MSERLFETPAIYSIPSSTNILKTSVDSEYLDEMIRFSEKHSNAVGVDNLVGRKRTDWHLNKKEGFVEAFGPMLEKVHSNLSLYMNPDVIHGSIFMSAPLDISANLHMFDCWTVWFEDGGATLPHKHGNFPNNFSTAFYLKLPKGKTSLTFGNDPDQKRVIYDIREGDMLMFPSNLVHYGFDHEKGRIMTSANWGISIDYTD